MFNWNNTFLRASSFTAALFVFMFTTSLIFPFMDKVLPMTISKIAGIEKCCEASCGCGIIANITDSCCCTKKAELESSYLVKQKFEEKSSCCSQNSEQELDNNKNCKVNYLSMLQCQGFDNDMEMSQSFKATLTAPVEAVVFYPIYQTDDEWPRTSLDLNITFPYNPKKIPINI